jgi:hypothetical protein
LDIYIFVINQKYIDLIVLLMRLISRNLSDLLLFVISLLACWFIAKEIRPELHYFLQQSAFLTDNLFFMRFAKYPGGIADYISEFIAQFFLFDTLGSFLIVLVASILGIIAIDVVNRVAGKLKLNFSIFGIILLCSLLLQCNYHYPFYASVRLLIAFAFIWIFTILASKYPKIQIFAAFFLAAILFYLAGGAALFVFTISAILIQIRFLFRKSDWLFLPVFAVFSGFLPYLAYKYLFLVDFSLVYAITHSKSPMILFYDADYKLYALYSMLPVLALLGLIFRKFKRPTEPMADKSSDLGSVLPIIEKRSKTIGKPNIERRKMPISPALWLGFQFVLLSVLAIVSFNFTFDKTRRDQILVSFYGANGEWDQVIKTAQGLSEYNLFTNVEYNKALANSGKLSSNLFNCNQLAGSNGLFIDGAVTSDVLFICSDQYYDLGFMNESQHWTFEAQTIFPNSPRLMKRLVQINLVNGKYGLAEKFLHRLNENMLYHDWVAKYASYISDTSLVERDPEMAAKRKCEPRDNFNAANFKQKLDKLIEGNTANKMAFDYLMSAFLLENDLASFMSMLLSNQSTIKQPLPRSWDEALVLHYYLLGRPPTSDEIQFSRNTMTRFAGFVKAMKPFGNDWQAARQSLKDEFGTSYWYYLKCLSPKVTKIQIKKEKFDE